MLETPTTPFAVAVYVISNISREPQYLVMRRCGTFRPGIWQAITGRVESGETAVQAAFREIQEETKLRTVTLYHAQIVETFYIQELDRIGFSPVFVASVDQINVQLSPSEHDDYEWLSFEQARKRLGWPGQQQTLSLIHSYFVVQKADTQDPFIPLL